MKIAMTQKVMMMMNEKKTNRSDADLNGYVEIKDNPITKVGVFEYSGAQISDELEPSKIYKVYRPAEELNNEECIASFKLVPWTDEHEMLGSYEQGLTPADKKGVHGVTGENVYFDESDGYLKSNLKVFTKKLANLIDGGKNQLSIGYRCIYDLTSGIYKGIKYDAIQREIRGNHLATVQEGRSGADVCVLDHFKFTFDGKIIDMQEEKKQQDAEISLESIATALAELKDFVTSKFSEMAAMEESEQQDECVTDEYSEKEEEVVEDTEEKKDDEKSSAMDSKIRCMQKEIADLKKSRIKSLMKEISKKDALANSLSKHIGVFDSSEMTTDEVAKYGVKKLGIACRSGEEMATLSGFLSAKKISSCVALDSNKIETEFSKVLDSAIENYMKG
jgi:hypothetical protein